MNKTESGRFAFVSCYSINPQKIKVWHTKFLCWRPGSTKFVIFKIIYSVHFESIFSFNVPTKCIVHDIIVITPTC
jgi:hypothetical protein